MVDSPFSFTSSLAIFNYRARASDHLSSGEDMVMSLMMLICPMLPFVCPLVSSLNSHYIFQRVGITL